MQESSRPPLTTVSASNTEQVETDHKKTQSDSGLITLGKRLNPKATKSSETVKRAKRGSDDMAKSELGSFGPFCVAKPVPVHQKEEDPRSHEQMGLKLPKLQALDQDNLSASDKSDSNGKEEGEELGESEDDDDSEKRRERRLLQNRKSAKKCRLKKKAEFGVLAEEVDNLKKQNKGFQEKINEITMMLYQKINENNALQRKVDQLASQNQQLVFQQQYLSLQQANNLQSFSASPTLNPTQAAAPINIQSLFTARASPLSMPTLAAKASSTSQGNSSQQQTSTALSSLLGTLQDLLKTTESNPSRAGGNNQTQNDQNKSLNASAQLVSLLTKNSMKADDSLSQANGGLSQLQNDNAALQDRLQQLLQQNQKNQESAGSKGL